MITLQLERQEFFAPLARELRRVAQAFLLEDALDLAPALGVAHDDEIPGLRETDAGRMMGRDQHPCQHFVRYGIGKKLAHIAPRENGLVKTTARFHWQAVGLQQPHSTSGFGSIV